MTEQFTKSIEKFIEETYETDAVVFQEVVFEEPNRKVISLCYYWNPMLELDYYELVHALKNDSEEIIICKSIGIFPQEMPKIEEIAKVIQCLLYEFH